MEREAIQARRVDRIESNRIESKGLLDEKAPVVDTGDWIVRPAFKARTLRRLLPMSQFPDDSFPAQGPSPKSSTAPGDLPPVEPPTAGFIVQLFIIPMVIVAVIVLVYLFFGRLAGGERDPEAYVETIRSSNENRRWRAAFELASLIQNDSRLAKDEQLLGSLTEELERELTKGGDDLRVRQYLCRTIGAFQTLEARSPSGRPLSPLGALSRALGTDQPTEVRMAAAESLARHSARLQRTESDQNWLESAEAVEGLSGVLNDRRAEPELRELAVFALGFLGGRSANEALRERLGESEESRFVRYNAAAALARRGDEVALPTLREMLSPADLRQLIPQETPSATESRIETIVLEAIQALQTALQFGHPEVVRPLRPELEDLSRSELTSLRTQASATLQLLQRQN